MRIFMAEYDQWQAWVLRIKHVVGYARSAVKIDNKSFPNFEALKSAKRRSFC